MFSNGTTAKDTRSFISVFLISKRHESGEEGQEKEQNEKKYKKTHESHDDERMIRTRIVPGSDCNEQANVHTRREKRGKEMRQSIQKEK